MSRTGRHTSLTQVILLMLSVSISAFGAQPQVAWQEEFDQPNSPVNGNVFYEDRGSGKSGEAVTIREVTDGVIRFGLKCDAARTQDRYNMLFGDCYWWEGLGGKWGPFALKDYPLLEVKWRGSSFEFWYAVETAGGQKTPNYTWLQPARKEKDAQGREWNISILRIAPDSSVPTTNTPVRLLGMNFCPYSPRENRELVMEIDSIKVRGFDDQERTAEEKIIRSLRDFPKARWRGYDSFFPFGTYFFYKRSDFESWNGDPDYEGAYGTLARHRFNYIVESDEVELGRFSGQLKEDGRKAFLDASKKLVQSAQATGMRIGLGISRLTSGRNPEDGYEQFLPVTKDIADTFPDDGTVISWYVWDEPSQANLLSVVTAVRSMRESDPMKRPELVVFNNTFAAQAYSAYLSLCFWDLYPILEGSRDPWSIRDQARGYRKLMPDKPMWVTLPAFETIPPAPKGSYVRPSDAEMRLMSHLAIAEGAKGLIWFIDWMNEGNLVGYLDRTGQPRGGMVETLEDLSKRLVPIGKLLLATNPLEDAKVEVKQLEQPAEGKGVAVSVLKHRSLPVHYLVVINEDLERPRSAQVVLPPLLLRAGVGVYDLYTLEGTNLLKGNICTVNPLAGGDGRVYLIANAKEFHRQRSRVQCETALEDIRVLTPDLTIARRWKVPLNNVDVAIQHCRMAVKSGDGWKALAAAQQARDLLARCMENASELNATQHALSDIRVELAEVSFITEYPSKKPRWWTGRDHPMLIPNPGFLDLSKRYWNVGRAYRDLYVEYLRGETEGLWQALNQTRLDCLKMREDVLAMLRERLKPAEQPATQ